MGEPQSTPAQNAPLGTGAGGATYAQQTPPPQPSPGANAGGFIIPLRNGATCVYTADQITVAGVAYPFSELVFAGLVDDVTLPRPPGAPPVPGVALHSSTRQVVGLTPIDPMDCWRLLTAIYMARPNLSMPLPPPVYAYAGYPPPQTSQSTENVLAGIAHLSIFFAPLITPLIIWLVTTNTMPYASRQGKQAFVFHCLWTVIELVVFFVVYIGFIAIFVTTSATANNPAAPLGGFFFLSFLLPLVILPFSISSIVLGVYAAIQGFQGKPYHYPLLGWL